MTIGLVAAGATATATGASVTPALPSGIATGDLLLCWVASLASSAATGPGAMAAPSGYTAVETAAGFGRGRVSLFMRLATASEAAPTVVFTDPAGGSGYQLAAGVAAYRGADLASPFSTSASSAVGSGGANVASGSTTSPDGGLVFEVYGWINGSPGAIYIAGAPGVASTSIDANPGPASGNGYGVFWGVRPIGSGGTTSDNLPLGNAVGDRLKGATRPTRSPDRTGALTVSTGGASLVAAGGATAAGAFAAATAQTGLTASGQTADAATLGRLLGASTLGATGQAAATGALSRTTGATTLAASGEVISVYLAATTGATALSSGGSTTDQASFSAASAPASLSGYAGAAVAGALASGASASLSGSSATAIGGGLAVNSGAVTLKASDNNQARYKTLDYAQALLRLLPRGRVWEAADGSVQWSLLEGLATSYRRSDSDANALLNGAFPGTASMMLPEWEATVGLPEIGIEPPTEDDRRRVMLARLAGPRGPSRDAAQAMAALFGLTVGITTYAPFRAGVDAVGQPLFGEGWAHAETLAVGPGPGWARAEVQARLSAMAPGHVLPIIA